MNTIKSTRQQKAFELKPYNKKELAQLYPIPVRVLTKWLAAIEDKLGKPIGRFYNIEQVLLIIKTYGIPGRIINENLTD